MEASYGLLCVIPVVLVTALSLATKNALFSLFAAAVAGCLLLEGLHPARAYTLFLEISYQVFANREFAWIILLMLPMGALILLLRRSGGIHAFTRRCEAFVRNRKTAMLATWALGLVIFIDDYLSILIVGTAMRGITDRNRISRQMLAFLVTSTGATICAVIPASTWSAFMMIQMEGAHMQTGMTPLSLFLRTMPFIFYAWFAILVIPLYAQGGLPLFGPMKRAEAAYAAREEKSDEARTEDADVPEEKQRARNFLLPLLVFSLVVIVWRDVMIGVIFGLLTCAALLMVQGIRSAAEVFQGIVDGMTEMFPMMVMMFMSYVLMEVNQRLGLTDFVIDTAVGHIHPGWFAAGVFLLSFVLAFATGTFWGLAVIVFPIFIPLAQAAGADVFLTAGAIISGCVLGAHTCFYGDTVILACAATDVNSVDYFKCAAPLCMPAALLSLIAYAALGVLL